MKRKLQNKRFKSISKEYLQHLQKSPKFAADLVTYCEKMIVFDILKEYPQKILKRFLENREFLSCMDAAKSKFDWIKFEMQAAIIHFLFVFRSAVFK